MHSELLKDSRRKPYPIQRCRYTIASYFFHNTIFTKIGVPAHTNTYLCNKNISSHIPENTYLAINEGASSFRKYGNNPRCTRTANHYNSPTVSKSSCID